MRLSSNRRGCAPCVLLRWDERAGVPSRGALRHEWPLLLSGTQTRDLLGGSFHVPSLGRWALLAAAFQRYGKFLPARSRDPYRGPISSSRHGQRAALPQAWPYFLARRVTTVRC